LFTRDQYELLDFGEGRKLERFGRYLLDRPSPAAEGVAKTDPALWKKADARYEGSSHDRGAWHASTGFDMPWVVSAGNLKFELKLTDAGHLGLFPEQAESWQWIEDRLRLASRPVKLLNLFGYTGGSTLAAASREAEVAHVDAARGVVGWARRNARLSGLEAAPVRWIVEDALTFVRRELKRGSGYDAIVLDPPSYGHGPHGELWKLDQHLPELLAGCAELTAGRRQFLLLTCHTSGYDALRLREMFSAAVGGCQLEAGAMTIRSARGRNLQAGAMVRCCS
jgi:23S rRNA (cytosine1962-C5)-methyltransferase